MKTEEFIKLGKEEQLRVLEKTKKHYVNLREQINKKIFELSGGNR